MLIYNFGRIIFFLKTNITIFNLDYQCLTLMIFNLTGIPNNIHNRLNSQEVLLDPKKLTHSKIEKKNVVK